MKNSLNNVTLRIHATPISRFIHLTEMNKKFDNSGFLSKFILLLQEYLGFGYEITSINYRERNELLMQNAVDLIIPVSQSFERSKTMDFSQTLSVGGIKFFIGKPSELSKMTAIIRPFLIHVWISIFLSFVISVIIFSIIFRIDAKLHKRKYVKVKEIAWALFGSFTAKGNNLFAPTGKSCQLLISGWIFATFIITSSYSGALMSFITFPGRETAPRTFSQLVKSANNEDYIIILKFNSLIKEFISQSTEGIGLELKKLNELNKIEDGFLEEKLIYRIAKEKLAYISVENIVDLFLSIAGSENFLVSEDQLFSAIVGFGMSKKFPYKKELNEAIIRFHDAGLYMKFKNDEIFEGQKKRQSIVQENENVFQALTNRDLAGPFLLLIIGYILSIVFFLCELIVKKLCG